MEKFHLRSEAELVLLATANGLVDMHLIYKHLERSCNCKQRRRTRLNKEAPGLTKPSSCCTDLPVQGLDKLDGVAASQQRISLESRSSAKERQAFQRVLRQTAGASRAPISAAEE